mgnify:CR=1 FL=1
MWSMALGEGTMICPTCNGKGYVSLPWLMSCPDCQGDGHVPTPLGDYAAASERGVSARNAPPAAVRWAADMAEYLSRP